jgi:hypothetical protein
MTIDKSETVTFPKWLVIVVVPILISAIVGFSAGRFGDGRQYQKIETQGERIENLEKSKVDKEVLKIFQDQLNRIEQKLDTK